MNAVLFNFWMLTGFSFVSATLAVAYYRFTQPGEVLGWWAEILHNAHGRLAKYMIADDDSQFVTAFIENMQRTEWVLKPILTCETCIAGQLAGWLFLFTQPFNLLALLYVISLSSVLAPWLLNRIRA